MTGSVFRNSAAPGEVAAYEAARLLGLRQSDSFCCSGEPSPETVASTQFIGNQELKR